MSISSSTLGGGRTKYKIIFLGDQSVGKSSIIQKYIKDRFEESLNPTVGIDFHIKNISRNGKQYRIQLWDTAGQQRFRSLIPSYMKDANCAIMVFDVTKPQSMSNISSWNALFQEHRNSDAIKVLVGNKIDLTAERQVIKKDAQQQAAKYKSKYFEVSAKNGKKLDELFTNIVDLIADHLQNKNKLPVIQDNEKDENKKELPRQSQNNNVKLALKNDPIATQPEGEKEPKKTCC